MPRSSTTVWRRWPTFRIPAWHEHVRPLSTPQGVLPYTSYVIRTRGKVELGNNACSFCHTRVMPDGAVIKGAQGNFPFDRAVAYGTRRRDIDNVRTGFRALFAAPWLKDADPAARVAAMTLEELATKFDAVPPGVAARHRASIDSPPAIPDLIGIRERRYLDRTGLVNHRGHRRSDAICRAQQRTGFFLAVRRLHPGRHRLP